MDSLILGYKTLEVAQAAGLTVTAIGDRLNIRGPRWAEPLAMSQTSLMGDIIFVTLIAYKALIG